MHLVLGIITMVYIILLLSFISMCHLFILYEYVSVNIHLEDAFIQSDVQMRKITSNLL